jgi:GNAT superfamily N-acetyltransferase
MGKGNVRRESAGPASIISRMSRNPAGPMAVRTSNEAYYRQVCLEETLDNAVAHSSEEHPALAECNFVSDVLIEELQAEPEAVLRGVQAFFAERGTACHRWIPALQQRVETLETLLVPQGYVREQTVALLRPPGPPAEANPRVSMLPARAMRRACTAVLEERFAGEIRDEQVEVHLQRLNDPQYDALVAMLEDRPAGFIAVHQVGEIGRIRDLHVMPAQRRTGVATAMLNYAIATAQRWLLRPICAQVSAEDAAGRALFTGLGFEAAGTLVRYRLADSPVEMVM